MGFSSDGKENGSDGKENAKDGGTDSGLHHDHDSLSTDNNETCNVFIL